MEKKQEIYFVKYKLSKEYAQIPIQIQDICRLTFKGVLVRSLYENIYNITNQSLEPINKVNLSLLVPENTPLFDVILVDNNSKRKTSVKTIGRRIEIEAEYLNPQQSLGDELEPHIYAEQPIPELIVEGAGAGWKAIYRGIKI